MERRPSTSSSEGIESRLEEDQLGPNLESSVGHDGKKGLMLGQIAILCIVKGKGYFIPIPLTGVRAAYLLHMHVHRRHPSCKSTGPRTDSEMNPAPLDCLQLRSGTKYEMKGTDYLLAESFKPIYSRSSITNIIGNGPLAKLVWFTTANRTIVWLKCGVL